MMDLKPLQDRVVVRRVDSDTVTKGGIFIPDAAAEKADQGTVLAVGPGKRTLLDGKVNPLDINVNDRVLFSKLSGQTVKIDGQELLILKEDDILAVIGQGE
jgi:chaperonin GroES